MHQGAADKRVCDTDLLRTQLNICWVFCENSFFFPVGFTIIKDLFFSDESPLPINQVSMENPNYWPSDFFWETKVAGGERGEWTYFPSWRKNSLGIVNMTPLLIKIRLMSSLYKNQPVDLSFWRLYCQLWTYFTPFYVFLLLILNR